MEKDYEAKIADVKRSCDLEIQALKNRLNNLDELNMHIASSEFQEILHFCDIRNSNVLKKISYYGLDKISEEKVDSLLNSKYKLDFILYLYPEIEQIFQKPLGNNNGYSIKDHQGNLKNLFATVDILNKNRDWSKTFIQLQNRIDFLESSTSNLTAIPYMAEIMADYETYGLEKLAKELDWGFS